jgi:hypothetical protein
VIEIKYNIKRDVSWIMEYREWTLTILNKDWTLSQDDVFHETTPLWVTINPATVNGDVIEIDYTVSDATTNATMYTVVARQMIF